MNGRMNNNESSQSSSTATSAQGINTENQHENAVPQQGAAAAEEVKVTPQQTAQNLSHMARAFGIPANYQAISQSINSGNAQQVEKVTSALYRKLADRGVDVTNIGSQNNAIMLDRHLSKSDKTMAAFDANPMQALSSLPNTPGI